MKKIAIITILSLVVSFRPALADPQPSDTEINLKYIKNFIKENPNDPNLYFVKGQILIELNKYNAAQKAFETVISMYPEYDEAYLELANAQNHLGKYEEALMNINMYLSKHPTDISAIILSGQIQVAFGAFDKAITLADQALDLDAENGEAYLLKGEALYEAGNDNDAVYNWQKARELGQVEAELHLKYLFEPVW